MKNIRYLLIFSVSLFLLAIFAPNNSALANELSDKCYVYRSAATVGKKGNIDLAKVFDDYLKTQNIDKALEAKGKEKQDERGVKVAEIERIRKEAPSLPSDERDRQQIIVDQKVAELQTFDSQARAWLRAARDAAVVDILRDIEGEVKIFGDSNGFISIVNRRCSKEGENITADFTKTLNSRFNENKITQSESTHTLPVPAEQPSETITNGADDSVSKLERLASLKEKGILTEDEFQVQKKKILSQ